jgi:hypothetical protein
MNDSDNHDSLPFKRHVEVLLLAPACTTFALPDHKICSFSLIHSTCPRLDKGSNLLSVLGIEVCFSEGFFNSLITCSKSDSPIYCLSGLVSLLWFGQSSVV